MTDQTSIDYIGSVHRGQDGAQNRAEQEDCIVTTCTIYISPTLLFYTFNKLYTVAA